MAFDYFSNLESPLGSGVGSRVVLRELHSQELGQGAERIVLGIDLDHEGLGQRIKRVVIGKRDIAFAMFGDFSFLLFVHLLGDQLHLHRVLLANFEVKSSHTELEN